MPFSTTQFTSALNAAQENWRAVNRGGGSFQQPQTDVPDLLAVRIFAKTNESSDQGSLLYNAPLGAAMQSATLRAVSPWGTWIYANGLDQSTSNVSWFGGQQYKRVCLHDYKWEGTEYRTRRGNCVAITPRCLLTTAHGSDPEGGYLYWCTPPNTIVPRQTSYYLPIYDPPTYPVNVFNIGNVVGGTNDGYRNGFRLLYLESGQSNLPEDMICPLLHPDDAPSLSDFVGLPVIAYNNYKEASVWQIATAKTGDGQSPEVYYFELHKSSDTNFAKLWRRLNDPTEPNTGTLDYDYSASNPTADAGSGTPVFLAFTNSVGQTQFVYFGHITTGTSVALGPSYLQYHSDIITALNHLNSYHGYSGSDYLPRYVTNSTWGTLTSGLQAYWKLIEANSSRANSVNSSYTLNQTASIGNT